MREDLYDEMFLQEKTYWWHVAKRALVQETISRDIKATANFRILDAGCGTGAMLEELAKKYWSCFGADVSPKSISFCKQRGIKNVRAVNFEKKLPFKNNFFNVITCLDVLEHVTNDQKLLGEFYRILTPGGRLYLTVPAYNFFWTYWDEILGHKRRYRRSDLIKRLKKTGFAVGRSSYFYSFLVPVALAFRFIKSVTKSRHSDFVQIPPIINTILLWLCRIERFIIFNFSVPLGLSIFLEMRKDGK